jgi:hypothetical protein
MMLADLQELFSLSNNGDSKTMAVRLPCTKTLCPDEMSNAETSTELQRELALYDRAAQRSLADSPALKLDGRSTTTEQTDVVRWVLTSSMVDCTNAPLCDVQHKAARGVEIMCAHGGAGVGKSRIAKRAMAEVRARGLTARACAFTWFAARNFENGTSLHALGCMSVQEENGEMRRIMLEPMGKMTHERLVLLRSLFLIVYDEGFSGPRCVPEALIHYLQSVGCNVRILVMGDSQQLTAIVRSPSIAAKVDANLVSSETVFRNSICVKLSVQHRQHGDPAFGQMVESIGKGIAPSISTHAYHRPDNHQSAVALPLLEHVFHSYDNSTLEASMREAIEWLYGRVDANGDPDVNGRLCTNNQRRRNREQTLSYQAGVRMRAIICSTNVTKDLWNMLVHKTLAEDAVRLGGTPGRTYQSVNVPATTGDDNGETEMAEQVMAEDSEHYVHVDANVPKCALSLQVGDTIMLAKRMCDRSGLVKNEMFTVHELRTYTIVVKDRSDKLLTVPRARFIIKINKAGNIKIARKQFPFHHAWAITVHKSQGQTFERDLIDMRGVYWEHGQAYVSLGRTRCASDTGAFVDTNCSMRREGCGPPIPIVAAVCIPQLLA